MKRSVSLMGAAALLVGLAAGTIWGQMQTLQQAAAPRTLPPDRVVATGHPPSFMIPESVPAVPPATATAPAASPATGPAATAPKPVVRPVPPPMVIRPPVARQLQLSDLLTLSAPAGRLHVDVRLESSAANRYFQANIEGFDGFAMVQYLPASGEIAGQLSITVTKLNSQPSIIQLTRSQLRISLTIGANSIEFTQRMKGDLGEATEDAGEVTLMVWPNPQHTGNPLANLHATDLRTLRIEQPEPFRQYVRPLLTTLHATTASLPDAAEAAQILTPRLVADAATEAKLRAILPALDADTREQRDEASLQLRQLGWQGALAAQKVDLAKLTIEQRVRLKEFLAEYQFVDAKQAEKCRRDIDVLVDCLALDDPTLVKAAVAQLEEVTAKKLAVDAALPAEKRLGMLEEWRTAAKAK